jgi:dihydroneopterin aldolase
VITQVEDTCDYAALYSLVSQEMKIPRKLLETLAMETVEKIHTAFPQLSSISYSITKLYAPIAKFKGQVNVHFTREY